MNTTYHYRLYVYVNDLNERIYKAKEKGRFGMWRWIKSKNRKFDYAWYEVIEWSTREDVLASLYIHAKQRLNDEQREELALKKRTLTLVVREDVPISVGGDSTLDGSVKSSLDKTT